MERFAKINVGGGKTFDFNTFSPDMQQAIEGGIADAWAAFKEFKETELDTGSERAPTASARASI